MKEEVKRIIKLVEEGKLSAEDASELIEAFAGSNNSAGETDSESSAPGASEEAATKKDFFRTFAESIEKISKDATESVNWKEISEQAKSSAHKGIEALKQVGEQIAKGKFEFALTNQERCEVQLPLALGKGKCLRIENPCGNVKIVGGFDEGYVRAVAKIRGSSVEDARNKAAGYTLVIEESEQIVLIKQPDMSGLSVDLEIQIPEKRSVEVKADSGDIEILDTKGSVRVNNRSGDILLRQLDGTIEVVIQSGDLQIKDSKTPSLTVESKSGDIDLSRVEGNVNARTASGDLKMRQSSGKTISIEAVSGNVEVDLDKPLVGSLNVRTVSGNSLVSVVDGSDARVSISTLRGEATCSVKLEDESREDQRVTGRIGEGKGAIDVSAVTGNVTLEMHNSAG